MPHHVPCTHSRANGHYSVHALGNQPRSWGRGGWYDQTNTYAASFPSCDTYLIPHRSERPRARRRTRAHRPERGSVCPTILEQTGECVRVRAANLRLASLAGAEAPKLLFLTLLPFEVAIIYDGVIGSPDGDKPWNASFTRAWTGGPGKSWASDVNDKVSELRIRDPIRTLSPSHALLNHTRWPLQTHP